MPRCASLRPVLFLSLLAVFAAAVPSGTEHASEPLRQAHVFSPKYYQHQRSWSTRKSTFAEVLRSWFTSEPIVAAEASPPSAFPPRTAKFYDQYNDQLVLRFNISTEAEYTALAKACNILFLDVWGQSGNWIDIRLTHGVIPTLLELLPASLQHTHTSLLSSYDLARSIAETYPPPTSPPSRNRHQHGHSDTFFDDYRSLQDMVSWTHSLASKYPAHVKQIIVGSTYEGRNIFALRIGANSSESSQSSPKRQAILISGGQHAREWISTSTVTYVASSFATSYDIDPLVTQLLDSLDFIFVPTLNPDGYEYTWSTDRLWRKNRQLTSLPFCRGIDLDRNWEYMWDGDRTIDNPCSESFAGEAPLAATETRTFAEWMKNETKSNNVDFVGFIDLHSYSQQILYPYSFSCTDDPPTLENLQELAHGLAKSIRIASRQTYKVLPACEGNVAASGEIFPRLEAGGGSLLDWFYQDLGVRKAFQIKLRDKGAYGFLLPSEDIVPTGGEIYHLLLHFAGMLVEPDSYPSSHSSFHPLQTVLTD